MASAVSRPSLKRAFDAVVSAVLIVLLSPVMVFIGVVIRLDSRGPALYSQIRIGEHGRTFRIYKFRTMCIDADARLAALMHLNMHARNGGDGRLYKLAADPRVTRFGTFLRRYSIDELPQLVNVVRGEMSLVGPRPLNIAEHQYVTGDARIRTLVKPGITGPWQVSGRNQLNFDEMMRLDSDYVMRWSFSADMRYLVRTLPAIVHPEQVC
jgi:lipopolysaccharide/colanic/teichoic acid biosynthesis glycosyltransferase